MTETVHSAHAAVLARRPKRADAQRNYDSLLAAAAAAFAEDGPSASLEDIARRAGVGIGTLYRNFPTRHALLEAVYVGEVEEISRAAQALTGLEPWEALRTWLHQYVGFAATKRALMDAMSDSAEQDAEVFAGCRSSLIGAGQLLLDRAQAAGAVRPDTQIMDVLRMVSGIAAIRPADPEQIARILDMALDGLRYTAVTDG